MNISMGEFEKMLKKMPKELKKHLIKKSAHGVKAVIQDRVVTSGQDANGKVMKYAPSTVLFKKETGREYRFKTLSHRRNRIWSSYQVVNANTDHAVIGWKRGSEGYTLAQKNQKRHAFNEIGNKELKAIDRILNDEADNAMTRTFT